MLLYIILGVSAVAGVVFAVLDGIRVKKMTKDKLIEKCKALIDKGRISSVQSTLMHYPKLLLIHFNELQTTLTDYARYVEDVKEYKKGGFEQ